MKKIILLSERLPYPPISGTKNLLYNYCKILHCNLGMDIINISFLEQDDNVNAKPDFISKTYSLPNPSGISHVKNIIFRTFIKREYPLQVSLFWDSKIKSQIDCIIKKEKPDCVIADFIRTTEYLKDYKGYKIADFQDLLSLRYERQLYVDLNTVNPYGAYLFRMPQIIQRILQISFIKKYVMKTEIELLRNFELNVGKIYDYIMFVAKNEAKIFDDLLGKQKSLVVPLGVDYVYFSKEIELAKKEHSIAFMGALNVAHNENGIMHFIENCMPIIVDKISDAKLYIIGGGASESLKKYESDYVIFMGRVPDVRVAVRECQVFICPLQFGSGIKTKNLEAMAMGLPVITTKIGAENIDACNGKEWIVAETDEEFSKSVIQLLNSSNEQRDKMGWAAKEFVKNNFTWKNAETVFKELINNEKNTTYF